MEAIATAAGVTRQTVYAHFSSREKLLAAVLRHATDAAVETLEALDLEAGSATEALLRLLEASARITERHRLLLRAVRPQPVSAGPDRRRHAPAIDRLSGIIVRGQRAGEFDSGLPSGWLAAVVLQLGHTARDEVDAGAMTHDEAATALRLSVLRVLGAPAG
jgi:AcrR family transcriptional regulator